MYENFTCLPGMEEGWYYGRDKKESEDEFDDRCFGIANSLWDTLVSNVPYEQVSMYYRVVWANI